MRLEDIEREVQEQSGNNEPPTKKLRPVGWLKRMGLTAV